jgi:hypothetical protein
MERPRPLSLRHILLLGAAGLSLIVTQAGCPGGAELENPDSYPGRFPSTAAGTGSAVGGTSNGGTGGSGTAGTGTSAILDLSTVDCGSLSAATVLSMDCASVGCHRTTTAVPAIAKLDLTPNDGLAARVKDVPAQHLNIQCSATGAPYMECIPTTCPAPGAVLLVNSNTPDASWMMSKVRNMTPGCGTPMPATDGYTTANAANEGCIEAIIHAIAALK